MLWNGLTIILDCRAKLPWRYRVSLIMRGLIVRFCFLVLIFRRILDGQFGQHSGEKESNATTSIKLEGSLQKK